MAFSGIGMIMHRPVLSRLSCHSKSVNWGSTLRSSLRHDRSSTRYFRDNSQRIVAKGPETQFPSSGRGSLLKPLGFTVAFGCCSFGGAAIWQYESMRKRALALFDRTTDWMRQKLDPPTKLGSWRAKIHRHWNSLSEGQRVAIGIIGINTAVFLLWRVPAAYPLMIKYFSSNPVAKAVCWPMFLSTFSHYSFWHLGINMYVFYSFSSGIVNALGKEQFLAMYLTAGVVSSFASILYKSITLKGGLSLGASGCIMGVLGFFCTQYPQSQLGIAFIPNFHFDADIGLKAVIALDTLGCILGWKLFDHAAHLGGVFFGIAYALWGRQYVWEQREPFLRWWNSIRGSPTD